MSEYWVSGKKYFCDYCRIYVQDNKASRQLHETSNKHKYSVARHLKGIHRSQDRKAKQDAINAKMLAQVERAALKQYEKDIDTPGLSRDSQLQLGSGHGKRVSKHREVPQEETQEETQEVAEGRIGEWTIVKAEPEKEEEKPNPLIEEEEEEVHSFRIVEKKLQCDEPVEVKDASNLFKKRKTTNSSIRRNARQKADDD